jgi:Phosphoglycerol transferase and related proteins, alkaline phosphatase superfamily
MVKILDNAKLLIKKIGQKAAVLCRIKKFSNVSLLTFYFISLFFMETIMRISTTKGLFSPGLLYSFIFSIPIAIIFYIISTLFQGKISYIISSVLIGLSTIIFCSQMIYYRIFRTFYTLYSAANGNQVLDFWKDILETIFKNLLWIILFLPPAILIIAFGKRIFTFKKITTLSRARLALYAVLIHIISLAAISIGGSDQYSPGDLYYKSTYPILSVQKLGLLTTMRLDMERLAINWSPTVSAVPAASGSYETGDPTVTPTPEPVVTPVEIKREYNTMNIDFSSLVSSEKNTTVQEMHKYFEEVQPTAKNEYTGKYKGYNLIFITAESFSPYAVREDVTPTLYKLVHEGYYFSKFYNPVWGVSTSDGEYVACTGLIPKSGVWSFKESGDNYLPFVMGNQFKALGYKTMAYHDHTYTYYKRNISHPNMGYTYKGVGNGLDVKKTWPESDLEMMQKTIPEYINSQPFHTYYMTVSGHLRYSFTGNSMASKNKEFVKDLPYSEQGKAYIAAQIELDKAMEYLMSQLEAAGIADKTLIALSADHYPYGLDDSSLDQLAGQHVERNFELYRSNFILYTEGMDPVVIDKPCSSLDIIPTLSNLLGLEYDSRILMGRDILSDSPPLVIFQNRSFITNKGRYNSETKEFTPDEGVEINSDYINQICAEVKNKFYYSAKILDTNYYKKVLGK